MTGTIGFGQWMFNPPFGQAPGILFTAAPENIAGFDGKFNWVQVYAPDQTYWNANGGLIDTLSGAGLDTKFPYGANPVDGDAPFKTDDSPDTQPGVVTNGPVGKIVVADHATMWLIYKASVPGSIWVPIDSVNWNWGGTDSNSGAGWILRKPSWSKNPAGQATHTYPVWGGLANKTPSKTP